MLKRPTAPLVAAIVLALTPVAGALEPDAIAVQTILVTRCAECHGPQLEAPEGGFGFVDDMQKMVEEVLIEPGDPDASDLYYLIANGDMPTEGALNGPVSAVERQLIHDWIARGAKLAEPAAAPDAPPVLPEAIPIATRPGPRWLEFVGKFHPATTHLPIALLLVALLVEVVLWCNKAAPLAPMLRLCLAIAAPAAVLTVLLGLAHHKFGTYSGARQELVEKHELLGIVVAVVAVAALVISELSHRLPRVSALRWLRRLLLLAAAALVGLVGHWGGLVSNGLDFYSL